MVFLTNFRYTRLAPFLCPFPLFFTFNIKTVMSITHLAPLYPQIVIFCYSWKISTEKRRKFVYVSTKKLSLVFPSSVLYFCHLHLMLAPLAPFSTSQLSWRMSGRYTENVSNGSRTTPSPPPSLPQLHTHTHTHTHVHVNDCGNGGGGGGRRVAYANDRFLLFIKGDTGLSFFATDFLFASATFGKLLNF